MPGPGECNQPSSKSGTSLRSRATSPDLQEAGGQGAQAAGEAQGHALCSSLPVTLISSHLLISQHMTSSYVSCSHMSLFKSAFTHKLTLSSNSCCVSASVSASQKRWCSPCHPGPPCLTRCQLYLREDNWKYPNIQVLTVQLLAQAVKITCIVNFFMKAKHFCLVSGGRY